MEVREPSREVPAHHWSKIVKVVYIEEGKKKGVTLLRTFLPKVTQFNAKRDLLGPCLVP